MSLAISPVQQDLLNDADGDALRRFVDGGSDLLKPMCIDFQVAVPDETAAKGHARRVKKGQGIPRGLSLIFHMKRISLSILLTVAIRGLCFADVTKLPADDVNALRDVSRFQKIHAATNLPTAIIALCVDSHGRFAEPGQKWEATDVITDDKLPRKRLIWAVTDGDYYVVHYERGGYTHTFHILVVKLKVGESKPSFVWRGVGGKLKDFSAFLDAVASNKLDDRLDSSH